MCIIAAKPAGVNMPSNDILRNMWNVNSDGAGFMYVENGAVRIEKGFMKYKKFITALEKVGSRLDLTATPVILHFRITTHGGTKPENTHPFPITENVGVLKKLRSTTDVGVAHNGVIHIIPRSGISDTMEYVASQLAPLKKAMPTFYKNKWAMELVENAIDSKMAFLTKNGDIYTIGDFVTDNGVLYSNHSYESWYSYYRYNSKHYYGDFDSNGFYSSSIYPATTATTTTAPKETPLASTMGDFVSVMFLDPERHYVRTNAGELIEPYDYLIDDSNHLYVYDYEYDGVYPVEGTAYTTEGFPVQYDEDAAELFPLA